jgi:hypothetical protein
VQNRKSVLFVNEYLFGPEHMQNIYYYVLRVQLVEKYSQASICKSDTGQGVSDNAGMVTFLLITHHKKEQNCCNFETIFFFGFLF